MTDATIRPGIESDAPAIARLSIAAFGGDAEAGPVAALRRDGDRQASPVATDGKQIVGRIAASPFACLDPGASVSAAVLAPLAVAEAHRRRGIAGALVRRLLADLGQRRIGLVFVLGDPDYCRRFGFASETAAPLRTPFDGPHQMAIEPVPGTARSAADRRFAYATGFVPFLPLA